MASVNVNLQQSGAFSKVPKLVAMLQKEEWNRSKECKHFWTHVWLGKGGGENLCFDYFDFTESMPDYGFGEIRNYHFY